MSPESYELETDKRKEKKNVTASKKIPQNQNLEKDFPYLENPTFKASWEKFIAYRRKKNKPLTEDGQRRNLKIISAVAVERAVELVEAAIEHEWLGVYLPRDIAPHELLDGRYGQTGKVEDPTSKEIVEVDMDRIREDVAKGKLKYSVSQKIYFRPKNNETSSNYKSFGESKLSGYQVEQRAGDLLPADFESSGDERIDRQFGFGRYKRTT